MVEKIYGLVNKSLWQRLNSFIRRKLNAIVMTSLENNIYIYKDLFTHKDINTYINGVVVMK